MKAIQLQDSKKFLDTALTFTYILLMIRKTLLNLKHVLQAAWSVIAVAEGRFY
jgi:hypothetical protein